jgi:hypothetical protein
MKTNVEVASFLEAFYKFLNYSDGSLSVDTLASFAKLKENKRIEFQNETKYWDGNHSSSNSSAELLLVEEPCVLFIVKYHYYENSANSNSYTETSVFVPNEN